MAVLGGMCINTKTVSPFNFKTSLPRVEGYSADFSSETLPHAKPSSAAFCSPTLDKTPKIPPTSLSQSSQNEVLGHGFWVIIHVFVFAALCTLSPMRGISLRSDHNTGISVTHSLRIVCGFFNVPQLRLIILIGEDLTAFSALLF